MAGRQKSFLRLERGSWRLEARTTAGILLVLALFGLLSWLCLAQATKVSTTRYRIREKEARKVRLQRENAALLAEVMEMNSISRLENMALGLDYIPAEGLRYLYVPGYTNDSVSGEGLAAVSTLDENAAVVSEKPKDEPSTVGRWWAKVISQFIAWARGQPQ